MPPPIVRPLTEKRSLGSGVGDVAVRSVARGAEDMEVGAPRAPSGRVTWMWPGRVSAAQCRPPRGLTTSSANPSLTLSTTSLNAGNYLSAFIRQSACRESELRDAKDHALSRCNCRARGEFDDGGGDRPRRFGRTLRA